jgi:hypothetical protein
MGLPLYIICFFSVIAFNILSLFSVLVVLMLWGGSIVVKTVWCPGGFLYLNGQSFLAIWEIFCYYCIEYITYPFSFTSSPSSVPMILRFGLLMESQFLHIPFTALEFFD